MLRRSRIGHSTGRRDDLGSDEKVQKIDGRDDLQCGDPPEFGSLNFTMNFFHDDGNGTSFIGSNIIFDL
jgi:hypothetical protein